MPDALDDLIARRTAIHRRRTSSRSTAAPTGDEDWSAVAADPDRAMAAADRLGPPGADATDRAVAADLLGAVADGRPERSGDVLARLLPRAAEEPEPSVLVAVAHALGRAQDPRTRPTLVDLADHADDAVRLAAVQGLPGAAATTDEALATATEPDVVAALVAATRDEVGAIRDWATFGLGQLRATGPTVDDALLDRTADPHVDTRAEALMALAERRDQRVVRHLLRELADPDVGTLVLRAAGRLADPSLHDAVVAVVARCDPADLDDPGSYASVAHRAALRCHPDAAAEAEQVEVGLLASLEAVAVPGDDGERVATSLLGSYPITQVVFALGERTVRSPIWDFDDQDPASPATIDHAFTLFRLRNAGNRL